MGNKITIGLGLLGMAIGLLPVLTAIGVLPAAHPSANQAPDWIGYLIGSLFFLAGLSVLIQSVAGGSSNLAADPAAAPSAPRLAFDVIGSTIAVLLATLFSWVAFGPGSRQFSISAGPVGMIPGASGSGELIGRIAFGVGAVVFWLMAARVLLYTAHRWFLRR